MPSPALRVVVTGSRQWTDADTIADELAEFAAHPGPVVLAFRAPGKSNGTDGCVAAARKRGIEVRIVHG